MKYIFLHLFIFTYFIASCQNAIFPIGQVDTIQGNPNSSRMLSINENGIDTLSLPNVFTSFEAVSAAQYDQFGSLLFYTNGCDVYTSSGQVMPRSENFLTEGKTKSSCERSGNDNENSIAIIPISETKYILLFLSKNSMDNALNIYDKLSYALIDLNLNSGQGELHGFTEIKKGALEAFAITRHGNGLDWWIVCSDVNTNKYSIYLLQNGSIHLNSEIEIGLEIKSNPCGLINRLLFSPDGNILARSNSCGVSFIDFDRCKGILYNYRFQEIRTTKNQGIDIAFNLYSNYLFVSDWYSIYRIDVLKIGITGNPTKLFVSFEGRPISRLLLLPNNSLIGTYPYSSKYMHGISQLENTDKIQWNPTKYSLPIYNKRSLCPDLFIDSGKKDCGMVNTDYYYNKSSISIFSSIIGKYVKILNPNEHDIKKIELINSEGKKINCNFLDDQIISTENLISGIYFLRIQLQNSLINYKFIVQ
jgi:hypothetical protein